VTGSQTASAVVLCLGHAATAPRDPVEEDAAVAGDVHALVAAVGGGGVEGQCGDETCGASRVGEVSKEA
jgi:uncharacterized low-complexity protein